MVPAKALGPGLPDHVHLLPCLDLNGHPGKELLVPTSRANWLPGLGVGVGQGDRASWAEEETSLVV